MTPQALHVDDILDDPSISIIVCTGAGGVGKTTTAAALGLRAAQRGRHVCVLTIDPARRLAQAMGLTELDNTPRQVTQDTGDGSLHAMMLDMKRTFDEVVEAHADPERAAQILENPFYQALSSSFAGTTEEGSGAGVSVSISIVRGTRGARLGSLARCSQMTDPALWP